MAVDAGARDLLYVANFTTVGVYSYPQGALEGQLTGFSYPYGDCTDKKGHVYITDIAANAIVEYAHGGTQPIRTLSVPGDGAYGCGGDPLSGDLAVTSEGNDSGDGGDVAIFRKAKGSPKIYTDPDLLNYGNCSYDDAGNLFLVGTYPHSYHNAKLAELRYGTKSLKTIKLDYPLGWIGGVQWDGQYLAVGQAVKAEIDRYRISAGNGTLVGTIPLPSAYFVSQFVIAGKRAIVANIYYSHIYDERGDVLVFNYPGGGYETEEIANSYSPVTSVALSRRRSR